MATAPRIGLLGGSFDPVHLGHLLIALDTLEGLGLDAIWFIPAGRNPHKAHGPYVADAHRVAMLHLATAADSRFHLWLGELSRPAPSYTIDTVAAIRAESPQAQLYWILGDDQFATLPRWQRIDELARQVEFVVLRRPGYPEVAAPLPELRVHTVACAHPLGVSSTEIRERSAHGKSIDLLLPPGVGPYLRAHALYTT